MTCSSRLRYFVPLFAAVLGLADLSAQPPSAPVPVQTPVPPPVDPAAQQAEIQKAFGQSLALRTDRIVTDSTRPTFAWLAQTTPAPYTSHGALQLRLALAPWEGEPKPVKPLGAYPIYGGNLANSPAAIAIDLHEVADGYYRYVAEVWDGEVQLAKLEKWVVLAAGLDEQQADTNRRLAKISGHDSAKASVLYPFDLARVINLGKRVYGSDNRNPEFGLSQAGAPQLYDFSTGLRRSAEILAALESGRDPVWRAGGDRVRHYHMPEADEILPYRVFVPSTWDGKSALPLVLILHGNSRDQDFYFDRDERIIPKNAEKHGFMLVAPLGYSPNGGYNYVPFNRERGARGVAAAMASPQTFGASGNGGGPAGAGGVNGSTTPQLVRSEWSEQDAVHVLNLIKEEYPIDPKRTFLFGYSAGGQGSHYFGQKYAENWAAVAIGGSNAAPGPQYDFDRLKNIPVMVFVGLQDPPNINPTRTIYQALKQHGIDATLKEYPGATHDSGPSAATPDVFDFFAAHGRK
jgi:poly(3-hydroxybutyrate) depolymerase